MSRRRTATISGGAGQPPTAAPLSRGASPTRRPAPPSSSRKRLNSYDVVDGSARAYSRRRPARLETQHEDELFPVARRNLGVNLARESFRNYARFRGQITQLRCNIVGPLGKLLVLTGDDWGRAAQDWFNSEWAESAEFFSGQHWGEWLQLVISAITLDGDLVVAFDDGTIAGGRGTGKLVTWEADQIAPLDDADFARLVGRDYTQQAGIIYDSLGRECGVIVTSRRGASSVRASEALILRDDPERPRRDRWWLHVKRHWRIRQGRGAAPALASIALSMDAYEVLAAELASAKISAALAAIVKRESGIADLSDDDFADSDSAQPPEAVAAQTAEELAAEEAEKEAPNYERIEALTGGITEYIDARDSIEFPQISRPNKDLPTFLDYVDDASGATFGLAHAYSRLRADSSYTAFRGDMVLTWVALRDNQKWLERAVCDWAATQALRWAQRVGAIPRGPDGWERKLAWQWPRMPEVDEGAYQRGVEAALRNGTLTYQELLGPAWREKFAELADELRYARELGIPLSVFETRAGAPITTQPEGTQS